MTSRSRFSYRDQWYLLWLLVASSRKLLSTLAFSRPSPSHYYWHDHEKTNSPSTLRRSFRLHRTRLQRIPRRQFATGPLSQAFAANSYLDTISTLSPTTFPAKPSSSFAPLASFPSPFSPKQRDVESLSVWALGKGVLLAPGIQLLEETAGEWSVSITKPCQAGAAIVTVPSEMILKSWATGHDR